MMLIMTMANLGLDIGTLGMTRMQSDKCPRLDLAVSTIEIIWYTIVMGHDPNRHEHDDSVPFG
jgi:hypothetical protein